MTCWASRYGARAFGPRLFWRDDIPETELEPIEPGTELPGGMIAVYDGRGRNETPLWVPERRALVFADALALVRKELWAQEERTFCGSPAEIDTVKVPRLFMARLTEAVCYAA